MNNLPLALVVTAGILAAAACDRDSDSLRPNAQTPASQSGQSADTSPSRPGPAGGQSARPGDLSPAESQAVRPAPGAADGIAEAPPGQPGLPAQASFDVADADKDGTVDSSEARAVPGLDFATADADRNESLSRQEFMTAMAGSRPPG
jgi:hypothetical protein